MDTNAVVLKKLKQHLWTIGAGWVEFRYQSAGAVPDDALLVQDLGLTANDMRQVAGWTIRHYLNTAIDRGTLANKMSSWTLREVANFVSEHGFIPRT